MGHLSEAQAAVRALLAGVGEDPSREGLLDTPKRVAKAMLDLTAGYRDNASSVLGSAYFHEPVVAHGNNGLVVVRDIDFASLDEETLLPFHGRCHVAYVPARGVVLGLSKLARLTRMFAKRLQTQPRLGRELATALHRQLQCQGVVVVLQAKHLHMVGSMQPSVRTTACATGCFTDPASSTFDELMFTLGIDSLPPGQVVHLTGLLTSCGVRRSGSCSGASDLGAAEGSSPRATGDWPIPPTTPDLSDHCSDLEHSARGDALSDKCSSDRSDGQLADEECGSTVDSDFEADGGPTLLSLSAGLPAMPTTEVLAVASIVPSAAQPAEDGLLNPAALPLSQPSVPALDPCSRSRAFDPRRQGAEAMEQAVLQLLRSTGEAPARVGGLASARRYVHTLLQATSGYLQHAPAPLYRHPLAGSVAQPSAMSMSRSTSGCGCKACTDADMQTTVRSTGLGLPAAVHVPGNGWPTPASGAGCSVGAGWTSRHVAVQFNSQCEHHMLPFYGQLHVVFALPPGTQSARSGDVGSAARLSDEHRSTVGGSGRVAPALPAEAAAIEHIVGMFTQRLQVQERITHQVADAVHALLGGGSAGVLVVASAAHMCMVARGVENHAGKTTSMALRGVAAQDAAWRARALAGCRSAGVSQ